MQALPKLTILAASRNGNLITLNTLIAEGADVNGRNCNGTTALMIAAMYGNHRAIDLLISRGAKIDARNSEGTTALMFAVRGGSVPSINSLLAAGADVNARDNKGTTALDQATGARSSYAHSVLSRALSDQEQPSADGREASSDGMITAAIPKR